MTAKPSFSIVPDEPEAEQVPQDHAAATQMILLGLSTLSKRAIIAISEYLWLAAVGSVFWIFLTLNNPNTFQLISLGMYAVFVLTAILIAKGRPR